MKKKSLTIFKSILCKLFWYLFILQTLVIIYFLAPQPCNPMIMIENDFVQVDGPNVVREGSKINSYTVRVNKDLNQELNVTLKYSGTAEQGIDYIAPKYVTIKKGALTSNFNIEIIDDPIAEFNEEFAVRIFSVTGAKFFKEYNVSNASNVIFTKISDEKVPKHIDKDSAIITINGAEEMYENNQTNEYIVHISQDAVEDIDLNVSYKGNATYGVDYIAPRHIVIKKGEHIAKFKITTIDDIYKEPNEHIDVFISDFDDIGFEDIRYERSHFKIHIKDEEYPSKALLLQLHSPQKGVENASITYKLTSGEPIVDDISLSFSIRADDKTRYKDALIATMKKGESATTFSVKVKDDNIIEIQQHLTLETKSTQNSVYELINIDMKDNTTAISDNLKEKNKSASISLATDNISITEDSQILEVIATSSQPVLQDLELLVHYSGTAQSGIDFIGTDKVSIKKDETKTKFFIKTLNDNLAEDKEDFSISIEPVSNGGLEHIKAAQPLIITLKDESPSSSKTAFVSLNGPSKVAESTDGNYTIHISQKLESDLKVEFTYLDDTAKASTDFTPLQSVTIKKGRVEKSFSIKAIDNEIAQTIRKFHIKIKTIEGGGFEDLRISPTDNMIDITITDKVDIQNAFKRIVASKKIVFEYAKATVNEKSFPILNDIAALLIQFPSVNLLVEGHTNSSGHRNRNLKLSKRRAKSVKEYLITQGVDTKRISSVGYGQSRPMVSDDNPKAQEINKRVEFKVKYRSIK